MKKEFPAFYRPSDDDFKVLWDKAIFVLDANVILNLYRYPTEVSNELLTILENIKTRIWIPYQVALEYQRNRMSVIAGQKKKFSDIRTMLNNMKAKYTEEYNKLPFKKRHSPINLDIILNEINKVLEDHHTKISELEMDQQSKNVDDPIRIKLDQIFENKIGTSYNQTQLDEIFKEGEKRYSYLMPPGYMDIDKSTVDKPGTYSFNGLMYKGIYGDLILWKQILDYAKVNKIENLIFLTDDDKEDWWHKGVGPRVELIQEIKTTTTVINFHMYNSEKFLEYAKTYLNATVSDESISQVSILSRKEVTYSLSPTFLGKQDEAQYAVMNWLKMEYPDNQLETNELFQGYIRTDPKSNKIIGYNVLYSSSCFGELYKLAALISLFYTDNQHKVDEIIFVIVGEDISDLRRVKEHGHIFPKYSKIILGEIGHTTEPFDSLYLPLFIIEKQS
ncbi:MAG: PIN domain-containing protein [Ignavibacteriaceae bacterium]|nr:PIN domain-containing protein [Ignavibacteriaceae bacterium]